MKTNKFEDLYELKCSPILLDRLEKMVYFFAQELSEGKYQSGLWKSIKVENEENNFWYFELNSNETWEIVSDNYISDNRISSKCFSLLAFSFALNYLMSEIYEDENSKELLDEIIELYNAIRGNLDVLLDVREKHIFYKVTD